MYFLWYVWCVCVLYFLFLLSSLMCNLNKSFIRTHTHILHTNIYLLLLILFGGCGCLYIVSKYILNTTKQGDNYRFKCVFCNAHKKQFKINVCVLLRCYQAPVVYLYRTIQFVKLNFLPKVTLYYYQNDWLNENVNSRQKLMYNRNATFSFQLITKHNIYFYNGNMYMYYIVASSLCHVYV